MISITSTQLSAWLALFIYPFVRILALVASAPILGNRQIPARIKVGLSLLLTFIIAPLVPVQPGIDVASAEGLFVLLQQVLAGLAVGFTMRLIFTAVEMCGDIAGMQMGLGFATFYDPQHASYTPLIAQFLGIVAALAFLGLNGHLAIVSALCESFQIFPISSSELSATGFHTLAAWGSSIFLYALQLSMPLIGALLITNMALGILARSAPQLNIFAIGFPITLVIGFIALALTLPFLLPLLEHVMYTGLETAMEVVRQFGHR